MKKLLILFLMFNYTLLIIAQPSVKWSKEFKSDDLGILGSIYADLKGNAYGKCSYFGQTVDIGSGTTYSATGYYKPMLVFGVDTSNGSPTWVSEIKPIAGCGCNYGARSNLMKTDNTGNLLIAGYLCNCSSVMAFGTQTLNVMSHHTFLAKYNKTGQLLWVKTKADINNGTTSADYYIETMTTDEFDNIYLSINSNLVASFAGVSLNKGAYLIKLNANGNIVWAKQTYNTSGFGVRKLLYLNSKLYAATAFTGNFVVDGHSFSNNTSYADEAILKLDTTGVILNKIFINSVEEDFDFDLKLLPNASLIYFGRTSSISGSTTATVSVNTNTYTTANDYDKYYFVKLDTSLNLIAYKNFSATNYVNPYVVSSALNNNIYLSISNSTANNIIDGITIVNPGPNILTIDNNLNVINAFKSASYYVCADKDANLYTTTSSTSVTINAFNTNFTPSDPETWSQYQIKLGPVITNVGTNNKLSGATIYPNPSGTGFYNLKINESIKQKHNIVITITNTLGQTFNNIIYTIEDNQTLQVNLTNFASGLYTITAIIDGKSYNAKLEKE